MWAVRLAAVKLNTLLREWKAPQVSATTKDLNVINDNNTNTNNNENNNN